MTNSQAVDEMLCVGWIDGIRHRIDEDSFRVRFTPRRPGSFWSEVNIRRVGELERAGRMTAAGTAAFAARDVAGSKAYAYEYKTAVALPAAMTKQLRANPKAWAFWQERPPWYRKTCSQWVMAPEQEATRARRLATLVDCSARGVSIPPLYGKIGGKTAKPTKTGPRARARRAR